MRFKKIIQLIFLSGVIVVVVVAVFLSNLVQKEKQVGSSPSKAEEVGGVTEFKPAIETPDQWPEFVHSDLKYRFRYPAEFEVEKRGKVGDIEDLVTLNYSSGGKKLTIVKIQLTDEAPQQRELIGQTGQDNNGNQVAVYKLGYADKKTLTVIGTVFPNFGSSFRFTDVIQKIAQSLKQS